MRLIAPQGNRLRRPEGCVYKEPDFRAFHRHGPIDMTGPDRNPAPKPDIRVADATRTNWVDRFCPQWSRPYLRLSRADRPAGTWLLLLPCWWGLLLAVAGDPAGPGLGDLWIFLICGAGAILMRGAGCTWNDITDLEFDAAVARTRSRPIPARQVSVKQAAIWMIAQALIAFALLLTLNRFAIGLGILALLPVVIYPFAKRFTWWPQVFLGLAFNWGALLGWAAHQGSLGWPPVLLYLAGICWTLFYDTIYAHQDKEDDALIGIRSTARLFADNTKTWLRGFFAASVLLMATAVILAMVDTAPMAALMLALLAPWAFGWHLAWQLRRLDIDNPETCLQLFRANREAGLIPVLIFAAAAIL
ncbi:MAG: 4-hydroxybenzoate octaprenyltransferase [Rhodobacteraceae bacterium]|nr:4-hydroxybenzoate octaprenyltransferase [Paracoccaceae bacterium]